MRAKILRINGACLLSIFQNTERMFQLKQNPLPKDARIVGFHWDAFLQRAQFLVESEEYPEVMEGCPTPDAPDPLFWEVPNTPAPAEV